MRYGLCWIGVSARTMNNARMKARGFDVGAISQMTNLTETQLKALPIKGI